MRLYEFEGINIFREEGIPVLPSSVLFSPEEARRKAHEIGLPVVVKAQVLTGGRGRAGAIRIAESLSQVEADVQDILSMQIKGLAVHKIMITKAVEIERELYLGVTVDGYHGCPVVMVSTAGGVSIEETASTHPELVVSKPVPINTGLSLPEAQRMVTEAGLDSEGAALVANILHTLYSVFRKYDALVAEINPLAITRQGAFIALDSKIEIDDSSLYRHPELQATQYDHFANRLERKGRQIGVTYVELDGEIGIIASGAGLGMATMDIISQKFRPANFLETGGAITADLLYNAMDLVMQKPGLKAIFINIYGGINPIHEGARGIARYIEEYKPTIPIVAKALGNRQEETCEILKKYGVRVVTEVATEKAVEELARMISGAA